MLRTMRMLEKTQIIDSKPLVKFFSHLYHEVYVKAKQLLCMAL